MYITFPQQGDLEVSLCLYPAARTRAGVLSRSELKHADVHALKTQMIKKKNTKAFLFLREGYMALRQVLHAGQLKVAASHFLRSAATIPTVPSSLVSRAACYLFRGECRVPLGECSVGHRSPLCCLIHWAGPKKRNNTFRPW